jgi:protein-disulfide isomerase
MRTPLLVICAALILAGALVAARATAPDRLAAAAAGGTATGDSPKDQSALGKSIREYLLANPEVLVEAMQELERRQDSQRDAIAQKGVQENQAELFHDADSPVGGNPNGDVVIVAFNDYQCPYCKRAYQALKSVAATDGNVKIIYKDLPILGEASKIAAAAALASVKQGKHVVYHNALMEFTGKLDHDRILEIAGSVGLDRAQLEKDMEDPNLKKIVERNLALATALGVRGTPAFVIGKQFIPGAVDAAALKQLIAEARKG